MPYAEALALMQELRGKRQENLVPDQLLLLEHPAVITMGRRDSREDLKIGVEGLKAAGIDFQPTDRGGRLTRFNKKFAGFVKS